MVVSYVYKFPVIFSLNQNFFMLFFVTVDLHFYKKLFILQTIEMQQFYDGQTCFKKFIYNVQLAL